MLTRKRVRNQVIRDGMSKRYIGFHPILQSLSRFLEFKDVSSVTRLNKEYNTKAWLYWLRHPLCRNSWISVDAGTLSWFEKYAQELKFQSIWVGTYHHRALHMLENQCVHVLYIVKCHIPILLPARVKDLNVADSRGKLPNLRGREITRLLTVDNNVQNLRELPVLLRDLVIISDTFNFANFPKLSKLTNLTISCDFIAGVELFMSKCPNVQVLQLHDMWSLNGLEGLTVGKLCIESVVLIDISPLASVTTNHLILKNCKSIIADWSHTKHIPKVEVIDAYGIITRIV